MAPSRRIAAVAQWVSVMRKTIIPPILQHRGRILLQRFLHLRLVDLDLDAGALELQQHRHARVTLAPAAVERLRHLHQRQLAQPHRHPELAADGGGEAHVLVRQAQREARRLVLVLQEIVAEPVVETLAAVGALAHGFPERERLESRLHAHREDLGERGLHGIARAVVHELGDGAGADRPDVGRLVAHRVEHGLVALEDLLVAADPDGELARLRAARPAAHRRVQHVHAALGEDLADPPHHGRRVRAEVEIRLAARHPVGERALDVTLELIGSIERGEGGDGDETAVALGQSRALPDVGVEHLLAQLDELGDDPAHFVSGAGRGYRRAHGWSPPPRRRRYDATAGAGRLPEIDEGGYDRAVFYGWWVVAGTFVSPLLSYGILTVAFGGFFPFMAEAPHLGPGLLAPVAAAGRLG